MMVSNVLAGPSRRISLITLNFKIHSAETVSECNILIGSQHRCCRVLMRANRHNDGKNIITETEIVTVFSHLASGYINKHIVLEEFQPASTSYSYLRAEQMKKPKAGQS